MDNNSKVVNKDKSKGEGKSRLDNNSKVVNKDKSKGEGKSRLDNNSKVVNKDKSKGEGISRSDNNSKVVNKDEGEVRMEGKSRLDNNSKVVNKDKSKGEGKSRLDNNSKVVNKDKSKGEGKSRLDNNSKVVNKDKSKGEGISRSDNNSKVVNKDEGEVRMEGKSRSDINKIIVREIRRVPTGAGTFDYDIDDAYCILPVAEKLSGKVRTSIKHSVKDRFNKISHILNKCKHALEVCQLCYIKTTQKSGGGKLPPNLKKAFDVWENERRYGQTKRMVAYKLWYKRFRNRAVEFMAIVESIDGGDTLVETLWSPFEYENWFDTAIAAYQRDSSNQKRDNAVSGPITDVDSLGHGNITDTEHLGTIAGNITSSNQEYTSGWARSRLEYTTKPPPAPAPHPAATASSPWDKTGSTITTLADSAGARATRQSTSSEVTISFPYYKNDNDNREKFLWGGTTQDSILNAVIKKRMADLTTLIHDFKPVATPDIAKPSEVQRGGMSPPGRRKGRRPVKISQPLGSKPAEGGEPVKTTKVAPREGWAPPSSSPTDTPQATSPKHTINQSTNQSETSKKCKEECTTLKFDGGDTETLKSNYIKAITLNCRAILQKCIGDGKRDVAMEETAAKEITRKTDRKKENIQKRENAGSGRGSITDVERDRQKGRNISLGHGNITDTELSLATDREHLELERSKIREQKSHNVAMASIYDQVGRIAGNITSSDQLVPFIRNP